MFSHQSKFIHGKTVYVFKSRPSQSRHVMRNLIDLLMCVFLFSCAERPKVDLDFSSVQDFPEDSATLYFPSIDVNESGQMFDSSTNGWISGMLFALREPVLMNFSDGSEVYRLTIISSRKHPFCIRLFTTHEGVKLISKHTDGYGGYNAGKLIFDSAMTLTDLQLTAISKKFDELEFWDMISLSPNASKDASEWVLEGYKDRKYKLVARRSPDWQSDKAFCQLCDRIIAISGLEERFQFFE